MNTKNNAFSVDVSPDMVMYRILQKQPFGVNIALAEFIDNSIQSFKDEKIKLNSINLIEPKIIISINSDLNNPGAKTITIKDNAAGISHDDFERAMKPGLNNSDPHSSESLSVYGVGMKFAAVWLSDTWDLETSHIKSNEIISLDFDLNNLLDKGKKKINAGITIGDRKDHYTRITITNCKRPLTKELCESEILPYLLETFERFADIKIELFFDNKEIIPSQDKLFTSDTLPPTMKTQPFIEPRIYDDKAADITWERKVNFNLGSKKIKGFIKLISKGRYNQPGIRLLRNNRVIVGTGVYPNRPPIISDTNYKYGRERIYGELHLEGFTVNDKKNGFDDDLEKMYQAVREKITEDPDLITQVNNFRTRNIVSKSAHQKYKPTDKEKEYIKPSPNEQQYSEGKIKESTEILSRLGQLKDRKLQRLYTSMYHTKLHHHPLLCNLGAWCFWEILLRMIVGEKVDKRHENIKKLIIDLTSEKANANAQAQRIVDINRKGNLIKHDYTYSSDASYLIEFFDYLEPVITDFLDVIIEKESRARKKINLQSALRKIPK